MVHSATKKHVRDTRTMSPDVHLVASRLRDHFSGLSSNFADMSPEALAEIAYHLVKYRDRQTSVAAIKAPPSLLAYSSTVKP
jgi:hypothetical protein